MNGYNCAIRPCKYDRYSPCTINDPDTLCEGCEFRLHYDEDYEEDPDREYERARDEGRL